MGRDGRLNEEAGREVSISRQFRSRQMNELTDRDIRTFCAPSNNSFVYPSVLCGFCFP